MILVLPFKFQIEGKMNSIILAFFFILSSYASPMEKMEKRLTVYNETKAPNCLENELPLNEGISLDVSCRFNCKGKPQQVERIRGAFIPSERGLFAGNGSSAANPVWSSLGVSLKSWIQDICLEKSLASCQSYSNISEVDYESAESGDWKMTRFPGCDEQDSLRSPFDDEIKASRLKNLSKISMISSSNETYLLPGTNEDIALASVHFPSDKQSTPLKNCKKIIKGSLCYGDCVDLNSKQYFETLATKEPLGRSDVEICGDDLFKVLEKKSLSSGVKKTICDSYFWNTLIHDQKNTYRSCAAIRGSVDCSQL